MALILLIVCISDSSSNTELKRNVFTPYTAGLDQTPVKGLIYFHRRDLMCDNCCKFFFPSISSVLCTDYNTAQDATRAC